MRQLLFVLAISLPLFAQPAAFKKAHLTSHEIFMSTLLNDSSCSSTAIGEHALLTATHCELPTTSIKVDNADATVEKVLRDGNDHSILLLSGVTFSKVAQVASSEPEVGDAVFIWGNPGDYIDLLRKGTLVGHYKSKDMDKTETLIDINGFFGDSGAAVFNMDGQVAAVISVKRVTSQGNSHFYLMGTFPLLFTDSDYKLARDFK